MRKESDSALMLRVKEGDPACLGELFERHHEGLYRFLLRMCGRRQWSEDMVQESFVRMLRYAATFRTEAAFLPWAYNIARHVAADYLRREARHRPGERLDPEDLEEDGANPEYLQGKRRQEALLQQTLLRLPAEKRELILLGKIRELSCEDLAGLYGCSTAAVKVRLFRAMEELRRLCEPDRETS